MGYYVVGCAGLFDLGAVFYEVAHLDEGLVVQAPEVGRGFYSAQMRGCPVFVVLEEFLCGLDLLGAFFVLVGSGVRGFYCSCVMLRVEVQNCRICAKIPLEVIFWGTHIGFLLERLQGPTQQERPAWFLGLWTM